MPAFRRLSGSAFGFVQKSAIVWPHPVDRAMNLFPMNILAKMSVILALALFLSTAESRAASSPATSSDPTSAGVELAQTISLITGVAISPLMGVSAVGAWKYFEAKTPEQQAKLPWYAQPWFWVPSLVLIAACFLKDTVGMTLPTVVKKPLDVAETIEHKVSGLIATGAFVPLVAPIFKSAATHANSLSLAGFASIDPSWIYNGIMIPIAMAAFFIVFMASNAINILILLSPFTTVDAALKGFRLLLLGSVAGLAWGNPWLGAAWSLVIITIAYFIAGWSFRLSWFGTVFVWDMATFRRTRFTPDATGNNVFLSRKLDKAPARTYGSLVREAGNRLVLKYRPWLVLPQCTVLLPEGSYVVAKGLIYSEISREEAGHMRSTVLLPPRYRSHEQRLADIYGLPRRQSSG